MRCLIAGLFAVGLVACGVSRDDNGTSATGITATGWQPSLPANTGDVTVVKTIKLRGCEFAVGTAVITPPQPDAGIPAPPVFLAVVERGVREHGPRWCTPGFIAYGASAGPNVQVDVAVRQSNPFLVLDYTFQVVQGGRSQLGIVELGAANGEIRCTTTLSSSGDITSGTLALDVHGVLSVRGTKTGTIPGETGSGPSYVAAYSNFLDAAECPSSPTSVVAF